MKANTPALILYFTACISSILLYLIGQEWLVGYAKAVVVPAIFYYYWVSSKFRIEFMKILVFLSYFIGEVIFMMDYEHSFMASLWSFFVGNLLLLWYFILDLKRVRLRSIDIFPILFVVALLTYLFISIINLKFDENEKYFTTFTLYGIGLETLGVATVMNFICRGSKAAVYGVLMFICLLLSDIFYLLYNYYLYLPVFHVITISNQVLSYFFMALYFLERNKLVAQKNA